MKKLESKFDYTKEDIVNVLREVGLERGDNLFVHSNLGFFGKLKGANDKFDYCTAFKNAIFEVIGLEGTLTIPAFSYSFCNNEEFDLDKTKSVCGIFSEYIRCNPDSYRSRDANFSISAIGKNAIYFTENPPHHSFGNDSFWERFLNLDGKICNFNFDSASTFIHYVEKSLNVPYRYDKKFEGKLHVNNKSMDDYYYHFVYDLEKPWNGPEFSKFDKKAKNEGIAKTANLGRGQVVCISAKQTFQLIKQTLNEEPYFLIKGSKINNPF